MRRSSARWQPVAIALLACAGLAGFAGYDLHRERQIAVRQARMATANAAGLVDAQVRQAFGRVLLALDQAQSDLVGLPGFPADAEAWRAVLEPTVRSAATPDGLVRGLQLFDPQGRLLAATGSDKDGLAASPPAEASDPAAAGSAPAGAARLVAAPGRPMLDRGGRWVLPVVREVRRPDGAVLGLLVALVDPSPLQAVFSAVDTGANGFITLFHRRGWLLVTAPRNDALRQRNWGDTPMFTQHLPASAAGTVQQVVVRDNTERIYSYRALADLDLVVAVGVSLTDALVDWRARMRWDALLLGAISLAMLAWATALGRHYRRREQAEQALADGARQTRAIVDHVADGIVTFDLRGRIDAVNLAAETIFGATAEELVGDDVVRWLPSLGIAPLAESDRREGEGRQRDGSRIPLEIAVTRSDKDGQPRLIALLRDIAAAKRAQAVAAEANARTEASEAFLRTLTDNLPIRLAYLDNTLRYRFVNQAYCIRFGMPRERILGHTRAEISGHPAPPEVLAQAQRALAGEPVNLETEEQVSATESVVIERRFVPDVGIDGQVRGIYVASMDVTDRHRQQRRIADALAERENLLREVYHRVKNNLQVVQSLLSLQRRALPPDAARFALDDSIQRVRAMALVHEKLYQAGSLSSVVLRDYTQDLLQQIAEGAGAHLRGISLVAEVEPIEVGLEGSVPYGLLVAELVGNALKHGFPGDRGGQVRVILAREAGVPVLRVADDGVGLHEGFDLQSSDSLGLQLAASLASQLGGRLEARDEAGAVFSSALPRLV